MGRHITFYHGPPDHPHTLICTHAVAFAAWYATVLRDYPEDNFPPETLALAQAIAAGDPTWLYITTPEQAAQVDRLVEDFFVIFVQHMDLLTAIDVSVERYGHYYDLASWLSAHAPPFVHRLWSYLLAGRAVGRDAAQLPMTPGGTPVGFWTATEIAHLSIALSRLIAPPAAIDAGPLLAVRQALAAAQRHGGGLIFVAV